MDSTGQSHNSGRHSVATLGFDDRFELLERIGDGGMGLVYRARQLKPVIRIVALKLVKVGMDTEELLLRFEMERQTLAQLDHPHIARMYDAGSTDTGRPFLVMEHVEGSNLLAYSDEHGLPTPQRLRLLALICRAVQHAHVRGVIHRDLKPANVLVTEVDGSLVPKVIDFGVSRVLMPEVDRVTLTGAGISLGTPAYMSPEQLRDARLADTRSDIYSLGVMCCELLFGDLPFDLDQGGRPAGSSDGRLKRPSTRLRESRGASTGKPPPADAPRGELDWVILKCLETRPEDRYQSAGELAEELERYLRGEPTCAAPPSRLRQLKWFVQRHKAGVAAAAAGVAIVLAALAGTSYGLIREKRIAAQLAVQKTEAESQRAEADRRRIEAEESERTVADVNLYLTGIFRQANPQFSRGWKKDLTLREALDNVAAMLAGDLAGQNLVRAEVCETISQAYVALGDSQKGLPLARLAVEIREKTLGPEHPKTYSARYNLGHLLSALHEYQEASELLEQSLEYSKRVNGPDSPTTLSETHELGLIRMHSGKPAEAETLLRDALSRKQRVLGPEHRSTLITANVLAALFQNTDRHAEAEPLSRATLQARIKLHGADHPSTLMSMINLSSTLLSLQRYDEALQLIDEGLPRAMRLFGADHETTRGFVRNRAVWSIRVGREHEALKLMEQHGYDVRILDRYLGRSATQPASQPAL